MNTTRTKEDLIAHYRRLGRRLADETLTDREAQAIRNEQAKVQAEIESIAYR